MPTQYKRKIEVYLGCSDFFNEDIKRNSCIFIHVPKAAGTSISHAIYGKNMGHYSALFYRDISKRQFEKYFSFAVVRNPWERVVSAYEFVRQNGTDLVRPNHDDDFSNDEFASFETFVTQWLCRVKLSEKDTVFQPQYEFICDTAGEVIVDYVGKIEQLDVTLEYVSAQLGRVISVDWLNKSSRKGLYRDYYSDETREIVRDVYSRDITMFGYEF